MDLVNRLKFYMDSSQLTISQFADRCGIPRPTMSQLMNGRNKRISDEVINKVHNAFPDLSILWLMFGEGQMTMLSNIEISAPQDSPEFTSLENDEADNQRLNAADFKESIFTNSESDSDSLENSLFDAPISTINTSNSSPSTSSDTNLDADSQRDNILFENIPIQSPNDAKEVETTNTTPLSTSEPFQTATIQAPTKEASQNNEMRHISIAPDAHKKIINIVVFYSDNSFQSFFPDNQ